MHQQTLDVGRRKPLYTVVQEEILNLIRGWDHSKPLPGEMDLSKKMEVSRSTVWEAIHRLENSDILYKRHGVGTFVKKAERGGLHSPEQPARHLEHCALHG